MPAIKSKDKAERSVLRFTLLALAIALGLFFILRAILTYIEPSRAYKVADVASNRVSAPSATGQLAVRAKFDPNFDAFHRAGQDLVVTAAAPVIGEDAPETDLNIKLTGLTVLGGGNGSAIIRLPDGKQSSFSKGDTVLRNVTLDAVYPAHIIISRAGTQERVTFERASGTLFQQDEETRSTDVPPTAFPQAKVEVLSQGLTARAQQALEGFTPERFFRSVRPFPVRENGQVIGYRLQSINRSLDLGELGYQRGDIVTHIGGTDLRQGIPDFAALQQQFTNNPSAASLTLNRNGEALTIRLEQ